MRVYPKISKNLNDTRKQIILSHAAMGFISRPLNGSIPNRVIVLTSTAEYRLYVDNYVLYVLRIAQWRR